MILFDWIFWFWENCFFSNKIFHVKYSKRLEVFVWRAVTNEGDSQIRCVCMLSPVLGTVGCLLSLQTQSHERLSHFAVMAIESQLFRTKDGQWWMTAELYYLRSYGTTSFSVMSQELQMWLEAVLSGGHTMHMALPIPSPLRARATTKCETLNVTFPSVVSIDRT